MNHRCGGEEGSMINNESALNSPTNNPVAAGLGVLLTRIWNSQLGRRFPRAIRSHCNGEHAATSAHSLIVGPTAQHRSSN
jgi:hypothetical protein